MPTTRDAVSRPEAVAEDPIERDSGLMTNEMRGWVTAEFRSVCLIDDPDAMEDPAQSSQEDLDDYLPPPDPPDGFDLLAAAPGVVTITTGVMRGQVELTISVLDSEPSSVASGNWDTIEEIGFRALSSSTRAASGEYYPFAADGDGPFDASVTPDGPGWYRVRAHESNRKSSLGEDREDDAPPTDEKYLVQVWPTSADDEGRRRLKGPHPTLLL